MAAVSAVAEAFDHLKIAVRERPLTEVEKASVQVMLRTDEDRLIAFYPDSKEGLVYNYDYFYPEEATQIDVFQTIGAEMVDLMMAGYSATCLSYGPSATGKTHTLFGSDQEPGLIQLTTKELFHRMAADTSRKYDVKLAYWEMSGDHIVDALGNGPTVHPDGTNVESHFALRKDAEYGGVSVAGLQVVDCPSWEALDEYIVQGNIRRIEEAERRNARWHGFLRLYVTSVDRNEPDTRVWCRMTFAHLKGPDRVGQKGARGDILLHGSAINKSTSLLLSSVLHSVDFRRRALKQLNRDAAASSSGERQATEDDLLNVMSRSTSFFHECKFTQVLAHAMCGLEACFMLGTVCTLDYHETTDTLENLQNAQQLTALLRRQQQTTDYGRLKDKLAATEAQLPKSDVADGHPLTELEEKIESMKARLGQVLNAETDGSGRARQDATLNASRGSAAADAAPPPAIPPMHVDQSLPRWKQSVLKGKMHGDRATVYIPAEKGGRHTYKGQWANGCKEGFGTHITKIAKYEGNFRAGLREGDGTLWTRPNEQAPWTRVYKGSWLRDVRHGRGQAWYANGDVYDGFFEHDVRSALGKLFLVNGDRIEGQFRNDQVDGWATLFRKNGDWFEGHWRDGMREGPGAWHYETKQQVYRGEWHRNTPKFGVVEDMPEKHNNEHSRYLPRVGLTDPDAVLAKEKALLDLHRRRLAEQEGVEHRPTGVDDLGGVEGDGAVDDNVSW